MGKRIGASKDLEQRLARLRELGCEIELTRGNHVKIVTPDGRLQISALTSVSITAVKKLDSTIRRLEREL